jgi:hypothetical protein
MRASALSSIVTLKHQHSDLPWLSPHAFGSPHDGQMLDLFSGPITEAHASTELGALRACSEQRIAIVAAKQAAKIVAFGDAGGKLETSHVRHQVTRRRGCHRAFRA